MTDRSQDDDVVIEHIRAAEPQQEVYRVAEIDFPTRDLAEAAAFGAARAGNVDVWFGRDGVRERLASFRGGDDRAASRRQTLEDIGGLVAELMERKLDEADCPVITRASLRLVHGAVFRALKSEDDALLSPFDAHRLRLLMLDARTECASRLREDFSAIVRKFDSYLGLGES